MSAGDQLRELADDLMRASRTSKARVVAETKEAAKQIGKTYEATARRSAQPRGGGHMADSVQIESDKGGLRQVVGPTKHWAFFQEHGTSSITGDNALRRASDKHAAEWVADLEQIGGELL